MARNGPSQPENSLLLDLPPLAQEGVLQHLSFSGRKALLQTSKITRHLVLDTCGSLTFRPNHVQQAKGLQQLLTRRSRQLHLCIRLEQLSEKDAMALLTGIATQPRPAGPGGCSTCCVATLTIKYLRTRRLAVAPSWGMLLGGAFRDIQALELQNGFINMQLLAGLAPCSKLTKLSMRDISMASTDEQLSSMLPAWLSAVTHLELHDSLPAIHVVKGIGARLQHLTFANKPTFRLSGIIGATRALTACKELRSIDVSVLDRVTLDVLLQLPLLQHVTADILGDVRPPSRHADAQQPDPCSWASLHIRRPAALHSLKDLPLSGVQHVQLHGLSVQLHGDDGAAAVSQEVSGGIAALKSARDVSRGGGSVSFLWPVGNLGQLLLVQDAAGVEQQLSAAVRALRPLLQGARTLSLALPSAHARQPEPLMLGESIIAAVDHACGSSLQELSLEVQGSMCSHVISATFFSALTRHLPSLALCELEVDDPLSPHALCSLTMLCAAHERPLRVRLMGFTSHAELKGLHQQVAGLQSAVSLFPALIRKVEVV